MLATVALIVYAFRTHQDNSTEGIYEAVDAGITTYQIEAGTRLIRAEGWVMFIYGIVALSIGWRKHDAIKKQKTAALHPGLIGFSFIVILLIVGHLSKPERRDALFRAKKDVPLHNETNKNKKTPTWYDITRNPDYQTLPEADRLDVKRQFFDHKIAKAPEFLTLGEDGQKALRFKFMQLPDDNGQSYASSLFGAFAQGFGLVIPYGIETTGDALQDLQIRQSGLDSQAWVQSLASVNPVHQEGSPVKTARMLGHLFFLYAAFRLFVFLKNTWTQRVRDKLID